MDKDREQHRFNFIGSVEDAQEEIMVLEEKIASLGFNHQIPLNAATERVTEALAIRSIQMDLVEQVIIKGLRQRLGEKK